MEDMKPIMDARDIALLPTAIRCQTRFSIITEYGSVLLPEGTPRPFGVPLMVYSVLPEFWKRTGLAREPTQEDIEAMKAENLESRKIREEYNRVHKMTEEELKRQQLVNQRIKLVLEKAGINYEDVKADWEEMQRIEREEEEERVRCQEQEERARQEEQLRLYEESLPPAARLFSITHSLALLIPRISAEARTLVRQAKNEAAEFLLKNRYEMPADVLARWIADKSQLNTLHANMGHLGVVAMISRIDDCPQCFECHSTAHKATSAELKEETDKVLEKKMVNGLAFSHDETLKMAVVDALQSIVQKDSKATKIVFSTAEHHRRGKRNLLETLPDTAGGN